MAQLIEVTSVVPASLQRLSELAGNLFFSWHRPTRALFEDLDPELWEQVNGNPRLLLRCVDQQHLDWAAANAEYLARYERVVNTFDAYLAAPVPSADAPLVAYFCAEYGFHESFPIYSGGLGILAGDYCKAASDEQLNFVAVGLLYRQGYFSQSVDSDGTQQARYADSDPRDLPVEPVRDAHGTWLTVKIPIAAKEVTARVWKAQVGRVSVYLLDSDCSDNSPADRDITHRLYGGDESLRIRQEMILGMGGVRTLRALGLAPSVWHVNEGHAAFLILELLRENLAQGLDFNAALELAAAACVFTTHTPVAAGHDAFRDDLFTSCFADFAKSLGVSMERLLELGRAPGVPHWFNMTRLALAGSRYVNGVSRIHGGVSAQLCADRWPEIKPAENPVGYITNGVHVPTFLAQTWHAFLDSHIGRDWRERLSDNSYWQALEAVPDDLFWEVAQDTKARMLAGVRGRLQREFARKALSAAQLRHVTRLLDPERPGVLTIGFARRFATYKRAALLLRDRARLARLVDGSERPVLFLFAGKAHPADQPGQEILREIKQLMLAPEFAGNVVFLEDYDMQLGRWLVSGVDVWLNTPIAPLEASGTSGMKAAINGRLNLSILDGWWGEGFDGSNGWGIPPSQTQDPDRRDALDSDLIIDTLEEEVVPLYYERGSAGLSPEWVHYCKRAMMTVIPQFNMRRMVTDYVRGMYRPAAVHGAALLAGDATGARDLGQWKQVVASAWPGVSLRGLSEMPRELAHAGRLHLRVAVELNGLAPKDVAVEFYGQRLLPRGGQEPPPLCSFDHQADDDAWRATLTPSGETDSDGSQIYTLDSAPPSAGQFSTEVRIRPAHPLLSHPLELGLQKRL
jgi:starch phosphorylase